MRHHLNEGARLPLERGALSVSGLLMRLNGDCIGHGLDMLKREAAALERGQQSA